MPRAKFRFEVYGGLSRLSRIHPEVEFRIVAQLPTGAGLLVILDIDRSESQTITRTLDEDNLLPEYEELHSDDQRLIVQYELSYRPIPYNAILESRNIIQFPLPVRNGWAIADLTTSQERISRLKDAFEDAGIRYEFGAVIQSTERIDLLTDRQQQCIVEAVERGYYDSPRQCTLTELADVFGVTKGAASGTLHRAERRIIKNFLGKPPI